MVKPNVARSEDGDSIAVALPTLPVVSDGVSHEASAANFDVVDLDVVYDHVAHVLDHESGALGDVDLGPTPIDGLVACEDQLLREPDHHVAREYDPEWLCLDHRVP